MAPFDSIPRRVSLSYLEPREADVRKWYHIIPNGAYPFLCYALWVTGDPLREEDYELWSSPIGLLFESNPQRNDLQSV